MEPASLGTERRATTPCCRGRRRWGGRPRSHLRRGRRVRWQVGLAGQLDRVVPPRRRGALIWTPLSGPCRPADISGPSRRDSVRPRSLHFAAPRERAVELCVLVVADELVELLARRHPVQPVRLRAVSQELLVEGAG